MSDNAGRLGNAQRAIFQLRAALDALLAVVTAIDKAHQQRMVSDADVEALYLALGRVQGIESELRRLLGGPLTRVPYERLVKDDPAALVAVLRTRILRGELVALLAPGERL